MVVPPATAVCPDVEDPGVAVDSEQVRSVTQTQPEAQVITGAALSQERPSSARPASEKPRLEDSELEKLQLVNNDTEEGGDEMLRESVDAEVKNQTHLRYQSGGWGRPSYGR